MGTTSEEEGERNLEYFQGQKLPWLRTFLQERGIQISSEGKGDNNRGVRPMQVQYPRRLIPTDLRIWLE